jgi:hypothetical protein
MLTLRLVYKDGHAKNFDFPSAPEIFRLPKRVLDLTLLDGWSSTSFKKREDTLVYDEI